ncbi:MAG TPA: YkgJ family cysteine cluster protein [Polyangiaceae bacterium]|nr:YkgJ family cysteine cluster protein [Polyangiaceae bacterium]
MPHPERVIGAEHLTFACNGCGDCCRQHRVALTHHDLERLTRSLRATPAALVEWLPPDHVDLDTVSASMVLLPAGPRLMVLAHARGACAFLDSDNRCQAYAARPLDCRLYPFVLERTPDKQVTRLSLFEPTGCGDRRSDAAGLEELRRTDDERWARLLEYQALVAHWNRMARHRARLRHRAHGAPEFLAFLDATPGPA